MAMQMREGVNRMAENSPTNQRLAEILQEVVREVRELKDEQHQLASEVRKLAGSSR
jgi:hypothetical protein